MRTHSPHVTVILMAALIAIVGCKKDSTTSPSTTTTNSNTDNYSSMASFFAQNGVAMQTYTITGSAGGSFTTLQGTQVTIPPNVFYNNSLQVIKGTVTIYFKDIYQKSDMLLSDMPTNMSSGFPLKSGGEFFIKATSGGVPVSEYLAGVITIKQPISIKTPIDSNMGAFSLLSNQFDMVGWQLNDSIGRVEYSGADYVFSLYQFNSPEDSGSWCNSDNEDYFLGYNQTKLVLTETDNPATYNTFVFLILAVLIQWCTYIMTLEMRFLTIMLLWVCHVQLWLLA